MSSYELAEWVEYFILEAEDERRAMQRARTKEQNRDDTDDDEEG